MTSIQAMIEESPRMKALSDYLAASPHDSDRKWAEYVALAPDLAGFLNPKRSHAVVSPSSASSTARSTASLHAPSSSISTTTPATASASTSTHVSRPATKDDLSPGARRNYEYITGNSAGSGSRDELSPEARRIYDYLVGNSAAPPTTDVSTNLDNTDLTAPTPTICSSECPSKDAPAPVSAIIPSTKATSCTTTGSASERCCFDPEPGVAISTPTSALSLLKGGASTSSLPGDLTALNVAPIAVDINATYLAAVVPICLSECPSHDDVVSVSVFNSYATQALDDCSGRSIDKPPSLLAEACKVFNEVPSVTEIVLWPPPSWNRAITPLIRGQDSCHDAQQKRGNELLVSLDSKENWNAIWLDVELKPPWPFLGVCMNLPMGWIYHHILRGTLDSTLARRAAHVVWNWCCLDNLHCSLGNTNWAIEEEQGQVLLRPWQLFSFSDENQLHVPVALGTFWCELFSIGNTWDCLQYDHLQQGRPPDQTTEFLGVQLQLESRNMGGITLMKEKLPAQLLEPKPPWSHLAPIELMRDSWTVSESVHIIDNSLDLDMIGFAARYMSCARFRPEAYFQSWFLSSPARHIIQYNSEQGRQILEYNGLTWQYSSYKGNPPEIATHCISVSFIWYTAWFLVMLQPPWLPPLLMCLTLPTATTDFVMLQYLQPQDADETDCVASRYSVVVLTTRTSEGQPGAKADKLQTHKFYSTKLSSWEGTMLVGQHGILMICNPSDWNSFEMERVLDCYCQDWDSSFCTRLLIQLATHDKSYDAFLFSWDSTGTSVLAIKYISGMFSLARQHSEIGKDFAAAMLLLSSHISKGWALYLPVTCSMQCRSELMLWKFANSGDGILAHTKPVFIPWDPGGSVLVLDASTGVNWKSTPQPFLHLTWDPGGSTQRRLEGKPSFKEGGLSATYLHERAMGRHLGPWPAWGHMQRRHGGIYTYGAATKGLGLERNGWPRPGRRG